MLDKSLSRAHTKLRAGMCFPYQHFCSFLFQRTYHLMFCCAFCLADFDRCDWCSHGQPTLCCDSRAGSFLVFQAIRLLVSPMSIRTLPPAPFIGIAQITAPPLPLLSLRLLQLLLLSFLLDIASLQMISRQRCSAATFLSVLNFVVASLPVSINFLIDGPICLLFIIVVQLLFFLLLPVRRRINLITR